MSSLTKAEIKYYSSLKQKKYRDFEKKFIIEGTHLLEELLTSKFYSKNLEKVFIQDDYSDKSLLNKISKNKIPVISIDSKTMNRISDTVTPQGIIGIVKYNERKPDASIGNLMIALDEINDPGNLGTILRTAYWFDVKKIALSKNSVDIYNPKVVRGSQGGLFNVSLETGIDLHPYLTSMEKDGFKIVVTDLKADKDTLSFPFDKNEKYILVFGNEANGISSNIISDERFLKLKIKSYSDCESLNLAVSVGIILNDIVSDLN